MKQIGIHSPYEILNGTENGPSLYRKLTVIRDKIEAMKEDIRLGKATKDMETLIVHYCSSVSICFEENALFVVLKCPSVFWGATEEEEKEGRAEAIRIFKDLIADYEEIGFGFPV